MEPSNKDALKHEALGSLRNRMFNETGAKGIGFDDSEKEIFYKVASISPTRVEEVMQATIAAFKQLGVPPESATVLNDPDGSGAIAVNKNEQGTLEAVFGLTFSRNKVKAVDAAVVKINEASRAIQAQQAEGQANTSQGGPERFINPDKGRSRGV